jgi:hypothetical protein
MRLTAPGRCPLRPARCNSRAIPFGLPICSTRSTGEKSTPRSSDDVATTHRRVPFRSPASTQSRLRRSSEPWCSAIVPAQSGRAARIAWYQISVCDRVFVKTIALSPSSIAATTCGTICVPRWPAQGKRSIVGGRSESTMTFLGSTPRTIRDGAAWPPATLPPSSASRACSRLPIVAESPHVRARGASVRTRARASSTCTPRLLPSSSCHSSTTTARKSAKISLTSSRVSSSERLSGVVTSAVGSRFR